MAKTQLPMEVRKIFYSPHKRANHGKVWDGKDLRFLKSLIESGDSIKRASIKLERSETACTARLIIIRTAILFFQGGDDQTIKDYPSSFIGGKLGE